MSSSSSPASSLLSCASHNIFSFDNNSLIFSSNFDNGNLSRVERVSSSSPFHFKVWAAQDNLGRASSASRHCAWFYFCVSTSSSTSLPAGCVLRIQIVNASSHSGLYKHDMRPVYKCSATNNRWCRIKSSVRFIKEGDSQQLCFEHCVDPPDPRTGENKIFFAFTYPYSYGQLQTELEELDFHVNDLHTPNSIFYQRELLTTSCDGRRVDLLTISSVDGISKTEKEPLLSGLFPEMKKQNERVAHFPEKEVIFISARVHSGEVPAQHTFKGILDILMDDNDLCGKELRARYVFKLIPMLNPDGVYRGHFRMDQHGHNLNRYYTNPDAIMQPTIYAAKSLLDYYANSGKLVMYLDMHAHASKRGCFIYGNVLDSVEDQIQNQLFCKLISMNTAHFDYEGCLFSKEHMTRIDPGDQAKGLTAEGSGRVNTYLAYGLIHSYTLECNYNTSRIGNEIAPPEQCMGGDQVTPPSSFTTNPEKYTPAVYAGVGRACVIAMLDIRGHNPCSRIPKSKMKTLDRVRNAVVMEVRNRKEYLGKQLSREREREKRKTLSGKLNGVAQASNGCTTTFSSATQSEEFVWKRVIDGAIGSTPAPPSSSSTPSISGSGASTAVTTPRVGTTNLVLHQTPQGTSNVDHANHQNQIIFIPARDKERRRRSSLSSLPVPAKPDSAISQQLTPRVDRLTPEKVAVSSPTKQALQLPGITHPAAAVAPPPNVKVSDDNNYQNYQTFGVPSGLSPQIPHKSATSNKLHNYFKGANKDREREHILESESAKEPMVHIYTVDGVESSGEGHHRQQRSGDIIDTRSYQAEHGDLKSFHHQHQRLPEGMVNTMGSSIRDLIREQSINKLIKMSAQPTSMNMNPSVPRRPIPIPNSSNMAPPPTSSAGIASNTSAKESPVIKDNRKVAAKTLHAAGVNLIVNGSTSVPLAPNEHFITNSQLQGVADSTIAKNMSKLSVHSTGDEQLSSGLQLPAIPMEVLHSSSRASLNLMVTGNTTGVIR